MADDSASSSIITIQLQDKQSTLQNHFEIDTSDNISSIFQQYAYFNGLSLDNLEFTYNDTVLSVDGDATPTSLGMTTNNDDDAIISVSLIGEALKEYTLVNAITTNSIDEAISILNNDKNMLLTQPLKWVDSDGQELCSPAIFIAIDYKLEELVSMMLSLYDTPTKSNNDNNDNKTSATTLINTLLSEGERGYTPLQWASWMGSYEIVQLLIEVGGAHVDEEAVSLSRENDHHQIATYLLQQQHVDIYSNIDVTDLNSIMDKACRNGDTVKVRQLLDDEQYDLDQWKDGEGRYLALSPMYMAVKFGHYDVVQLFTDRGSVDDMESALTAAAEVKR